MFKCHGSFHHLKNNSLKYLTCNTEKTQNHTLNKNLIIKQWICPYISRHLLSLNPLLACCRRYSRGER
ncbi:hypothetical protein AWP92_10240 [Escherichia coli]|nr:hypothetical protein AWP92_10240 [Escherichia coli]